MANIQNYLNQIKTAVFGKDVRESIHDAIKQCYDDASINHDNANMEVKLARGSHNTLNDRLDENEKNQENLSSQLDTKVNQTKTIIHYSDAILDYTNVINTAFAKGGIIEFEAGEYRITNSIYIDTAKVKKVIGNNAIIIMENEDKYIRELVIKGNLQGSAPPDQTAQLLKEKNVTIEGLRIRNKTWGQGVAFKI